MELCGGDDLGQFLHVSRLDVDDVKALVLDVKVPEIDAQVVTADEGLSIAVDRYAVDMVCMGVCIYPPGHGCDDCLMVRHARELEGRGVLEGDARRAGDATAADDAGRGEVAGQVVLRHYLERLVEDLP